MGASKPKLDWLGDPVDPPADPPKNEPENPAPGDPPPVVDPPKKDPPKNPDVDPEFRRGPGRPPKVDTKEENIANLRTERDDLRRKLEAAEKLAKLAHPALAPIVKYFEEKHGGVDEPTVKDFITRISERKRQLGELNNKLTEEQKKIRNMNIMQDEAFQKEYAVPHHQAKENILAEIANYNGEDIVFPELFHALREDLLKLGKDLSAPKVKGMLQNAAARYKEKTGLDYEMPSVSAVVKAVSDVYSTGARAQKAYEDWDNERTTAMAAEAARQEEERQTLQVKNRKLRKMLAHKGYDEFDHDLLDGVFTEDEVSQMFHDKWKEAEGFMENPDTVPSYDVLMQNAVKAVMFDKIAPRLKGLYDLEKRTDKKERDGLPAGSSPAPLIGGDQEYTGKRDWLGDPVKA